MTEITEQDLREAVALKAFADADFRETLKADAKSAIEGILNAPLPETVSISVIEDSEDDVHFVIPPLPSDELSVEQLEAVAGGLMDPLINIGDQNLCLGGGLINTKMEINL